ncbi:MAG: phage baseplate assembly protein V [Halopseudomonas sp.]|uniref:phage baseplate assembly protein V n=1 Tax=Halopseudomonas sp. TaxID=2901191 RepID=UPI0030026DE2
MDPIAELRRRLDNLIRPGTVYAVDAANVRCRVKSGQLLTDWLPYFVRRAGSRRDSDHPTNNEQAVVFSPSGELGAGFVLVGLNSDAFPSPNADPNLHSSHFADGTWFGYDQGAGDMTVVMTEEGQIHIIAPGGVNITGPVNITGLVTVTEDVIAAGISQVHHQHPINGGSSAPGPTGEPQ